MQRRNVMLDDETWQAAQYLAAANEHKSASAAIRQAVKDQAKRKGWKVDRTPSPTTTAGAEDEKP